MPITVPEHLTADELEAQIPEVLRADFERSYQQFKVLRRVHTDADELGMVRELQRDASQGVFPYEGQTMRVNPRADVDAGSTAAVRSRAQGQTSEDPKKAAVRWLVIMVVAVIAVLVIPPLLRGRGTKRPVVTPPVMVTVIGADGTVRVVTQPPTTPGGGLGGVLPTPAVTPPPIESVFDGQKIKLGMFYPKTLEIGGVAYFIIPTDVSPTKGWQIPQMDGAASWINGSIVNYILGLPYTETNIRVMGSLKVGDRVLIRTSTAGVLEFIVRETKRVPPQQVEIFQQGRQGITICLTGDPAIDRLVVLGDYDATQEIAGEGTWTLPGTVALNLWQSGTAGDMQVRIAAWNYYTPTSPAVAGFLPEGQALYVLDVALHNGGSAPLKVGTLQIEAVDIDGIRYPSNDLVAKRYGSFSSLTDLGGTDLAGGESISLSVAYMVPLPVPNELTLGIVFPDSSRVLYDLSPAALVPPLTPTPTPPPTLLAAPTPTPALPQLQLAWSGAVIITGTAEHTPTQGLFLALSFTVTNSAAAAVQLQWTDFVLVCADGASCAAQPAQYAPAPLLEFGGQMVNALPATLPAGKSLRLLLVFDIGDVPAVKLLTAGQEYVIQLREQP